MRQTRMSRVLGPKLLALCEYAKRPRFALTQDATKRVPTKVFFGSAINPGGGRPENLQLLLWLAANG
jgi:hypothetical protein